MRVAFSLLRVLRHVGAALAAASLLGLAAGEPSAFAQSAEAPPPSGTRVLLDWAKVRYFSPELGGPTRPRFITYRQLSFEAHLELMAREGGAFDAPVEERHLRGAVDLHVAQDLLAALPLNQRPTEQEVQRLAFDLRSAVEDRAGGAEAVSRAARDAGITDAEVDTMFRRAARAAYVVDRIVAKVLAPTEEQLREVFRTASHPYRGKTFEAAREGLARWYIEERLRIIEATFMQTARARVRVVTLPVP